MATTKKHVPTQIDTKELGLALAFLSPGKSDVQGAWKITFDTGVILYVPDPLFEHYVFHLEEKGMRP